MKEIPLHSLSETEQIINKDIMKIIGKYPQSKLFLFFDEVSTLKKFGRGFFVHNRFFEKPAFSNTNSDVYKEAIEVRNKEQTDSKAENTTNLFYGIILTFNKLIIRITNHNLQNLVEQ